MKGKKKSQLWIEHHAEAIRGKMRKSPTEETRHKLSVANKGKKAPWVSKRNLGNKYSLGKHMNKGSKWWNNGMVEVRSKNCPEGFVKGRLKK